MSATAATATRPPPTRDDYRLRLDANPLRLACSPSPWLSARYLFSYLIVSSVLVVIALTAATTAAGLAVTILAVPLLIGASKVVHWCAGVERGMLRQVFSQPVRASYPQPEGPGLWTRGRSAWRDAAFWRELGYLTGLWIPLYALDTIVVSLWLTFLAGMTLPIWYWAPRGSEMVGYVRGAQVHGVAIGYFPHGASGPGAVGLYVDTLPKALLAAAVFAVLFLLFNYVLVATARMHGRVARALLGPSADPLDAARNVLTLPGPLGPLVSTGPSGQDQPDDRLLR
jgi:hypothetical protein